MGLSGSSFSKSAASQKKKTFHVTERDAGLQCEDSPP